MPVFVRRCAGPPPHISPHVCCLAAAVPASYIFAAASSTPHWPGTARPPARRPPSPQLDSHLRPARCGSGLDRRSSGHSVKTWRPEPDQPSATLNAGGLVSFRLWMQVWLPWGGWSPHPTVRRQYLKPSSVALLTERFAQLCSVLGLELFVWFYSMLSVLRPLRIPAHRPTPTPNRMLCVRRDLGRLLQVIMLCQRAAWPHFPCGARQGEQSI